MPAAVTAHAILSCMWGFLLLHLAVVLVVLYGACAGFLQHLQVQL